MEVDKEIYVSVHFCLCIVPFKCAQDNLGIKKVLAPSKYPWKCPITYLTFSPQRNANITRFQNQQYMRAKLALFVNNNNVSEELTNKNYHMSQAFKR